jgi:hypothetical protein
MLTALVALTVDTASHNARPGVDLSPFFMMLELVLSTTSDSLLPPPQLTAMHALLQTLIQTRRAQIVALQHGDTVEIRAAEHRAAQTLQRLKAEISRAREAWDLMGV